MNLVKIQNVIRTTQVRRFSCSLFKSADITSHTGQEWEDSDRRLARFTDKPKQINEKFAINLIAEVPPKIVKERIVSCNGGGGALGHPKVFINLDKPGPKACGYCGLRFVKEEDHHH